MPETATAFVFPAFVRDYHNDKSPQIDSFYSHFQHLLKRASRIVDPDLLYFHPKNQDFLDHELRTQYVAFIYGCAISDILQQKGIHPTLLSGYSMGIYAALVQGGAISFEQGLMLILHAFQEISYTTMTGRFGMAGIIGLSENDIQTILESLPEVEITNRNSSYSFVLSGRQQDLEQAIDAAHAEGAFHARMLNVTVPYHSHLLKSAALQFAKFVYTLDIRSLTVPLISVLNQEILNSPEDVKTELVENLYKHFNWFATQLKMLEMGIGLFIECGPGKSLKKNARFIAGEYRFLSMDEVVNH